MKTHNPKILVVGDLIIDEYLWGSSDRISPEAPVQIVTIKEDDIVLGGAGNVIKNLKALGAKVDVISVIGDCLSSKKLTELLKKIKVSTQYLTVQKDQLSKMNLENILKFHKKLLNLFLSKSKWLQKFA